MSKVMGSYSNYANTAITVNPVNALRMLTGKPVFNIDLVTTTAFCSDNNVNGVLSSWPNWDAYSNTNTFCH